MMQEFEVQLPAGQDLYHHLSRRFPNLNHSQVNILSKSLDARRARQGKMPHYLYKIALKEPISGAHPTKLKVDPLVDFPAEKTPPLERAPIIVGAGPAGLFAALRFLDFGWPSIIVERGAPTSERMLHISQYWKSGVLNQESNVCFGEGGAGLFSDGKLNTRVKSPYVNYVMQRLVSLGAPEEILYEASPHLGSNRIRKMIKAISDHLVSAGCVFLRGEKVQHLIIDSNGPNKDRQIKGIQLERGTILQSEHVILATGHSASDMYEQLAEQGVSMEEKPFAVGVRIEHPRELIDSSQYGDFKDLLGAARYRLSHHNKKTNRGTYSFCMCPGGYVLSSSTDKGRLVSNGMSNAACNSPWSNSALVVTVHPEDYLAYGSAQKFQESIERKAYQLSLKHGSGKELPAMSVSDFLKKELSSKELPPSSAPSKIVKANIRTLFPNFICEHLEEALFAFDKKIPGFISEKAILIAPETRTSAPRRILRDERTLESCNTKGLYPCGEGAGHAGGITSAAVDGIKVAMAILNAERSQ